MKKHQLTKPVFPLFLCVCVMLLMSCAARINGSVAADGSASLSVNIALEPQITSLFNRFNSAIGGNSENAPILDGPAIAKSMSAAPGIAQVSFKNTAPAAIEGTIRISNIGEFLAATDGGGFISFQQSPGGGKCVININRGNGPVIFELLSPEISSFLELFMAPIVTGEVLTKTEYLDEVRDMFNKPMSDEIAASRIRVSIDFPGQITSVKGGTFSGKRANFDVPLVDLLVLETPLVYEVSWK